MKFGAHLNEILYPEWKFYYLDYDGLKRKIKIKEKTNESKGKMFSENDEASFIKFLEKELEKVSFFK